MGFQVRSERRPNTLGLDDTVWVLEGDGDARLEIWPALGFNCYRWRAAGQELLYADPKFFDENKPSRSGIPILFPFPNRIRDGRYTWEGKTYQLPLNDSSGKNAIHGFACRKPWRVMEHGSDATNAWITGEFHGATDAPESLALWPSDYRIRVTYRLDRKIVDLTAVVDNPSQQVFPFGLGYHPYYRVQPETNIVASGRDEYWELTDNLPTGKRLPVNATRDLRRPRAFRDLRLDDILTGGGWDCNVGPMTLIPSLAFRHLVAFTPPHREAVCLEPYTCITDAINLEQRGVEAGWLSLAPGATWTAAVRMQHGIV